MGQLRQGSLAHGDRTSKEGFLQRQLLFPSAVAVFVVVLRAEGVLCRRAPILLLAAENSHVSYSFHTFFGGSCSIHCETG